MYESPSLRGSDFTDMEDVLQMHSKNPHINQIGILLVLSFITNRNTSIVYFLHEITIMCH